MLAFFPKALQLLFELLDVCITGVLKVVDLLTERVQLSNPVAELLHVLKPCQPPTRCTGLNLTRNPQRCPVYIELYSLSSAFIKLPCDLTSALFCFFLPGHKTRLLVYAI